MAVPKKWYEHPRPIPFDQLQQRIMIERYDKENILRRNWLKKYEEFRMKYVKKMNKCLCMKKTDKGNSLHVFVPNSNYKNERAAMEEEICCCQQTEKHGNQQKSMRKNLCRDTLSHEEENENIGESIRCLAFQNPARISTDTWSSQHASKFSGLKWPPKCKKTTIKENICRCEQNDSRANQQSNMRENVCTDALTHKEQRANTGKSICCLTLPNPAPILTDSRRSQHALKFLEHKCPPKCNGTTKEEDVCCCEQTDSLRNYQNNMQECNNALAHERQKLNSRKSICCPALLNPASVSTDSRRKQHASKFCEHNWPSKCQ